MTAITAPHPKAAPKRRASVGQRGVSIIESMMVLVIAALLLSTALPYWQESRLQRHLEGAAAQLETDIQYTRSLAVAQRRSLRLSFFTDSSGSCYVVHSGAANACSCDASGAAQCGAGATAHRSVRFDARHPVLLQSNVRSIVFAPTLGTSTPTGTIQLQTSATQQLRAVVNVMGRVRHCAPATATSVSGYPRC